MTDFKPVTYDALMSLDLDAIEELFPLGAIKVLSQGKGQDRWRPAQNEEDADRSLKRMLRDKKNRVVEDRYLDKNPARPPTTQVHRAARNEPTLVGKHWENEYAEEARMNPTDRTRKRVMRARIAQLKQMADRHPNPMPHIERAIEEMKREAA